MKAGRDLDALIAEKIMGFIPLGHGNYKTPEGKLLHMWGGWGMGGPIDPAETWVPEYSTDISAAWEVLEKAKLLTYPNLLFLYNDGENYCIGETNGVNDCIPPLAKAATAPRAICLAALKTLEASP